MGLAIVMLGLLSLAGCSSTQGDLASIDTRDQGDGQDISFDPRTGMEINEISPERPVPAILAPRTGLPPSSDLLPQESTLVINRRCRMEAIKPSGWYRLRFENEPGKPAEVNRWIMPGAILTEMQAIQAEHPKVIFVISGETVRYGDLSYLLVRLALAEKQPILASPPVVSTRPASMPVTAQAVPATEPARQPLTAEALDPDEVIRRLLTEKPADPILTPVQRPEEVKPLPSVAPAVYEQLQRSLGALVADRVVRVWKDTKTNWWMASFESDNTLQEQPMRLLPCGKLAQAQRLSASPSGRSVKLRITGEVFQYNGRQYLLLRKVLRERIMGQI